MDRLRLDDPGGSVMIHGKMHGTTPMFAPSTSPLTFRPALPGGRLMHDFTPEFIDRFWAHVDRSGGPDACWLWLAGKSGAGYGQIRFRDKVYYAHRIVFALTHGYWPEMACHSCDNPPCCNPTHLRAGNHLDNMSDVKIRRRHKSILSPESVARGDRHGMRRHPERVPRGERHGRSKLTTRQVCEMREARAKGVSLRELAERYGVKPATVKSVCGRRLWKWLHEEDCDGALD